MSLPLKCNVSKALAILVEAGAGEEEALTMVVAGEDESSEWLEEEGARSCFLPREHAIPRGR